MNCKYTHLEKHKINLHYYAYKNLTHTMKPKKIFEEIPMKGKGDR